MALTKEEKTRFAFLTRMLERKDINASIDIVKRGSDDRLKYSESYSFIRDIALVAKEDKYRSELKLKITDVQISECIKLWSEKEKPKAISGVKQGLHLFDHEQPQIFGKQQFEELFEKLFPGHKLTPR